MQSITQSIRESRASRRPGAASRRGHWFLTVAALTAALFFLAACADNGDDDAAGTMTEAMPAQPASPDPTPADATPADATPAAPMDEADATVMVATEGTLAPYLVDAAGMTLYLFTNDEPGVSNCTDACLASWPPLLVADGEEPIAGEGVTGELGVIERADGEGRQVTYDGMPLYYWAADTAPGDTTGHEVVGVWFVVPPGDASGMGAAPSTQATPAAGGAGY